MNAEQSETGSMMLTDAASDCLYSSPHQDDNIGTATVPPPAPKKPLTAPEAAPVRINLKSCFINTHFLTLSN